MDLITDTDLKLLESLGAKIERLEEGDLEPWFDHVAMVFDKTGRGYFVDHYLAQPVLKFILVIKKAESKNILSTMRIFEHQIVLGVRTEAFLSNDELEPSLSDLQHSSLPHRINIYDVQALERYLLIRIGGVKV